MRLCSSLLPFALVLFRAPSPRKPHTQGPPSSSPRSVGAAFASKIKLSTTTSTPGGDSNEKISIDKKQTSQKTGSEEEKVKCSHNVVLCAYIWLFF